MVDALLDTSVIIDLLRTYPPAVVWLSSSHGERFGVTKFVWLETVRGSLNKHEMRRAITLLNQFTLIEHRNYTVLGL